MVNEKERIIKKMGTICTILYPDGAEKQSKFFVRKATSQFTNMIAIESQRKGDFLYVDNITGGCIVTNNVSNESYLVVATNSETFRDMVLSTVTSMFICNSFLTVYSLRQTADENGNITKNPEVILDDCKVYSQVVDQTLKQYAPGLHEETEFIIYAPYFKINTLDQLVLTSSFDNYRLKVVASYTVNYPGIVVIEAKTETRK